MTTVINNALHANEADAGYAEVPHQFFWMNGAKIRILSRFLVLGRILERQVVFRQLLCFERLIETSLAQRAES